MNKTICLALVPLALVSGTAAQARKPTKPVACMYSAVAYSHMIDADKLHALVLNHMQPQDGDDKMILQRIGQAVYLCKKKNGWGDAHVKAADTYMQARLYYDTQKDELQKYGVKYDQIAKVLDGFTPEQRQTWQHGTVTEAMLDGIVAQLNGAGATVGTLSADDKKTFYTALDRAIVSALAEDDAEEAFKAG